MPRLVARKSVKAARWMEVARSLYVDHGLSQRRIAVQIPINAHTIGKWAVKGGWEAQRQALQASPQGLSSDLEKALRKLVDDLGEHVRKGQRPWKGAADEILKFVRCIEVVKGDAYWPAHLARATTLLTKYLQDVIKKPELAGQLAEVLVGFATWAVSAR